MKPTCVFIVLCLLLSVSPSPTQAQTPIPIAPNIFLRGVPVAQGIRYAATIIKPDDTGLMRNVSVEITLPADAVLTDMLVPRQVEYDVIRRNQQGQLTLIWQTSWIEPDQSIDVFAFTLAQPLTSEVEFFASWLAENDSPVVENFLEVPPIVMPEQVIPAGTQARPLAAEFNPPPDLGSIWWCSLLELDGLPTGARVNVSAPLRRPVAPFTPLSLFHQQPDGSWIALDEQGVVTADGQFVIYTHPGGIVAAGGGTELQPSLITAEQAQIINVIEVLPTAAPLEPPATQEQVTDGASNTILFGEVTATPVPAGITDGASNTILFGEVTATPVPAGITDGASNTILFGEVTATPAPAGVTDGASNTILFGEVTATPAPAGVTDGASNTILFGEVTATPVPAGVTDGASNTILFGEVTATPAPATISPTVQPTNTPTSTPISTPVQPPPFGRGGPRVEIVNAEGKIQQCQVGRVNCAPLNRRPGNRTQ